MVQIASGSNHNAAITDEGKLFTWGKNDCGQLGHGEGYENMGLVPELVAGLESVKIKQVSCGHFHTAALSEDGELFTWGWGGSFFQGAGALGHGDKTTRHEPEIVQALLDDGLTVEEVQCGKAHTLLRTSDGEVWSSARVNTDDWETDLRVICFFRSPWICFWTLVSAQKLRVVPRFHLL